MAKKQPAKGIKLYRTFIRLSLGLWLNRSTGVENTGVMTRADIDKWLNANGITYSDKFYVYGCINMRKTSSAAPDRLLRIRKLEKDNQVDGKYVIEGALVEENK